MFEFLIKASFMSIYLSIYLNVPKIISKDAFNVNTFFNRGISISFYDTGLKTFPTPKQNAATWCDTTMQTVPGVTQSLKLELLYLKHSRADFPPLMCRSCVFFLYLDQKQTFSVVELFLFYVQIAKVIWKSPSL